MRGEKQIAKRVKRAAIANELILWMEKNGETSGWMAYPMVGEFARDTGYDHIEVWKARDLLKEAGRLACGSGHGWELLESTPIALDEKGDLVRNV